MKVGLKKQKFLLLVIAVVTCLVVLLGDFAFSRFTSSKAYACDSGIGILDPTCPGRILNPGDRIGDAGAGAYQAAAEWMRANNGSSQSLDEMQKRYLRPHFGDLVDRVAIVYNANLMDEWSALGYRINLQNSAAQTYCNRIYVDDPYQQGDLNQIILLGHELFHSKQCEEYGGAGSFGWHYFKEFYEGGGSYENNRLEREAFDFQAQFEEWAYSQPGDIVDPADFSRLPVFDPDFYLFSYGDLRRTFGNQNHAAATEHWLRHGISEGRISSAAFDVRYYLNIYPDLQNAFGSDYRSAIDHWLRHGISEGRSSSAAFDVRYYLNRYPDLQNAFGSDYRSAINHWLSHGVREGRQGSQEFDPAYYLTNNPDVARVYGANNYKGAIEHWLEFGRGEGRRGTP